MRPFLVWDPATLAVHVEHLDREHQGLIALMNQLYREWSESADLAKLLETFAALERATVEHFRDEERHMRAIHYVGQRTHELIHGDLLRELRHHGERCRELGGPDDLTWEFLHTWLSAHIQGIDRKYMRQDLGGDAPN